MQDLISMSPVSEKPTSPSEVSESQDNLFPVIPIPDDFPVRLLTLILSDLGSIDWKRTKMVSKTWREVTDAASRGDEAYRAITQRFPSHRPIMGTYQAHRDLNTGGTSEFRHVNLYSQIPPYCYSDLIKYLHCGHHPNTVGGCLINKISLDKTKTITMTYIADENPPLELIPNLCDKSLSDLRHQTCLFVGLHSDSRPKGFHYSEPRSIEGSEQSLTSSAEKPLAKSTGATNTYIGVLDQMMQHQDVDDLASTVRLYEYDKAGIARLTNDHATLVKSDGPCKCLREICLHKIGSDDAINTQFLESVYKCWNGLRNDAEVPAEDLRELSKQVHTMTLEAFLASPQGHTLSVYQSRNDHAGLMGVKVAEAPTEEIPA